MVKLGSQLFTAHGPQAVRAIAKTGMGIFLDLKFHDIPNTVEKAAAAASGLPGVRLMTIHTLGGLAMMQGARKGLGGRRGVALLGVTILTSMDGEDLRQVGIRGTVANRAVRLALLAQDAGLDGAVTSAHEVAAIRKACGPEFRILVPGIRPAATNGPGARRGSKAKKDDQRRIATPTEAILAGANYLVVGRPITAAIDPRGAALSIAQEIRATRAPEQNPQHQTR
jgi:orotidine-5'-phosphate decarboxylase